MADFQLDRQLIFLIGPARSGTKILRDVLSRNSSIDKVAYDINFIWKHKNESWENDEIPPEALSAEKKVFVSKYLAKHLTDPNNFLIEKTVSNTIRVSYLLAMYPQAKFIFLLRDGYDVIESVYRQWFETPPKSYLIKKAREIPLSVLIKYVPKFIKNLASKKSQTYHWGVKVPGLDHIGSVEEKIAYQWMYCIRSMSRHKEMLPNDNLYTIRYEDLAQNPKKEVGKILQFISPELKLEGMDLSDISSRSIGKGRKNLSAEQMALIQEKLREGQTYLNDLI